MSRAVARRPNHVPAVMVLVGAAGAEISSWPLVTTGRPARAVVEDVARAALIAGRLGCSVRVRGASPELSELLELVGLRREVPGSTDLSVEVGGEPE